MNTPVVFDRHGDTYTVTFSYDPDIVAVIKTLPGYARSWSPHTKHWFVDDDHAGLAAALRELGCTVLGLEDTRPTPARACGGWAHQLFAAVGPARTPAVHRPLTRILHPDTGTGDAVLQRELNDARTASETSSNER